MVDIIYIAASARDGDFTRICVASVRRSHPTARVELLPGGKLEASLLDELRRYWDVGVASLPLGNYGWGFVKLEPLFVKGGQTFLILDSDTVVTGPVLDKWNGSTSPFFFDDEAQTDAESKRLYYDWDEGTKRGLEVGAPAFVANTGQWFGTAGVLSRSDFEPWLEWAMPRRVHSPEVFKQGEQGLLNFVLNRGMATGKFEVERGPLMHWPAWGMEAYSVDAIERNAAPAKVIHWAGLKRHRRGAIPGADVLDYFERLYYARMPNGRAQRTLATAARVSRAAVDGSMDHARLITRRIMRGRA